MRQLHKALDKAARESIVRDRMAGHRVPAPQDRVLFADSLIDEVIVPKPNGRQSLMKR
jgi:hypothetical protein